MNIIKKILSIIFNPFSLVRNEKTATERAALFQKYPFLIAIIAIVISAGLIFLFVFSGLF